MKGLPMFDSTNVEKVGRLEEQKSTGFGGEAEMLRLPPEWSTSMTWQRG